MKRKRILSALLAGLLMLPTLASCATAADPIEKGTSAQTTAATEADTSLRDDLPDDLYFDDDEITIAGNKRDETKAEIAVEALMGEPVNDAVFERNTLVEKRLGVKIIPYEEDHNIVDKVTTAVKAGSAEFDAMAAECFITLPKTLEGVFADLNSTMYLNLEQPWWSQGLNEAISHQDTQYIATGSMLLSLYRFGFITVFNKRLFDEANQPYLYEHVENGTWTLDKQIELIPIFHRDNGNGVQDEEGDIYGFITSDYTNVDAYWSACQLPIIGKTEDNEYEFVFDSARVFDAAEKLIKLFHDTDDGLYALRPDDKWPIIRQMFADGYGAMASFRLLELENATMRNMVDEFGVAPIPKYDELQKEYRTLLHDQFTVVSIPTTVTEDRLDMVSAVLEALSSTGYRVVRPVYYEDTLRTKIAQDPQSAEMMDIIVEGVYIDAGIIYIAALNSFHHELRFIVQSGQNDTVSRFKSRAKVVEKNIKQINIKLARIAMN
jgi:ABC-type glycerol-3-phosphate transport system substrate-binding protein